MQATENIKNGIVIEKRQLEPCLQEFDFTISPKEVENKFNSIAKNFAKEVKFQGFRPGKAPTSLVVGKYKKDIESESIKELVQAAFKKACSDESLDLLTYAIPKDKEPKFVLGEELKFTFRLNLAPEINIPNYKGIAIELEGQEVSEKELENRINYFKEIYGTFDSVSESSTKNDMIKISYTSDAVLANDVKESVKRLANADFNYIWIQDKELIPGINAEIIGKKAGETFKFTSQFPVNYEAVELAGKTVNYDITILEVQRKSPIKTNEELCNKLRIKDIAELKEKLSSQIKKEIDDAQLGLKRLKAMDEITKDIEFSLPPDLLNDVINSEFTALANSKFKDEKDKEKAKQEFEAQKDGLIAESKEIATKKLRNFLLLRKIGQIEKINVTEEEVEAHINNMSHYYGYKAPEFKKQLIDSGNINQVVDDIIINKVTDLIVENAVINYTTKA